MKIVTLQPSPRTDHITEDGQEFTQLPYPFHVTETGEVLRQDFWRGDPARIVGFTKEPQPGRLVYTWEEVAADPQRAVGLYIVSQDRAGRWAVHVIAVAEVQVRDAEG